MSRVTPAASLPGRGGRREGPRAGRWAFSPIRILLALPLLLPATMTVAQQETTEQRLREALRRTTIELRALQDARAGEQAALAEARRQRDLLQQTVEVQAARLAEAEAQAAAAGVLAQRELELAAARQDLLAARAQIEAYQKGLQEWQQAYEEVAGIARAKEEERRQAQGRLERTSETLALCQEKNEGLLRVADEVLRLYQKEDFLSVWRGSFEPVLGLRRVELETILQDYRDKVLDQQFLPETAAAGAPAAEPSSPAAAAAAAPAAEAGQP